MRRISLRRMAIFTVLCLIWLATGACLAEAAPLAEAASQAEAAPLAEATEPVIVQTVSPAKSAEPATTEPAFIMEPTLTAVPDATVQPAETVDPAGTVDPAAAVVPDATADPDALFPEDTEADESDAAPAPGLEVYYFDLERVDGILIRCEGASCFIDVGYHRDAEKVLPYLKALGVEKLDCYIGTHAHADHIEGAPDIIYALRPDVVYVPHKRVWSTIVAYASKSQKDVVSATPCKVLKHGDRFMLGGAEMRCLGPINVRNCRIDVTAENDNSLICKLTYGARSFLFTGDTTDANLEAAEKKYPGSLACDVLKNPHHNGHHSDRVLSLTSPKATVFCTGDERLPGDDYLRLLKNHKSAYFITCSRCDGNVLITSDGESLEAYCGYPLESVKLDPVPVLIPGARVRMTGELAPAKRADPERWLNWKSSDPGVVKVSKGTLTAVSEGVATITATAINGVSDSVEVVVSDTSVLLDKSALTVKVGEAERLRYKLVGADTTRDVEWLSEDSAVAIISDGEVIGMGVGQTRIIARCGAAEAVCEVTVEEIPVKYVELDREKLRLKVGERQQLGCKVRPTDATDKRLEWASSDESIATVDEFGNVTAVGPGSAKIGVRAASGVYDVCKVKVE